MVQNPLTQLAKNAARSLQLQTTAKDAATTLQKLQKHVSKTLQKMKNAEKKKLRKKIFVNYLNFQWPVSAW